MNRIGRRTIICMLLIAAEDIRCLVEARAEGEG
jgi:hypothetical protein